MLFNILTLISLLIILLMLRRLVGVIPSLLACMIRWKESVNLEASVQLSRDRDYLTLCMIIPFCLTSEKFGLYTPGFLSSLDAGAHLGATIGIFIVYILLRYLFGKMLHPKKMNPKTYKTAAKAAHTFFSLLTLILLAAGGVMAFIKCDPNIMKSAMLWISAAIYLLFIIRKTQIFISSCSLFAAFLYLCALEIIPTGALVASAIIF